MYPVSKDELINVVAFSTNLTKQGTAYPGPTFSLCTQEEVLNLFCGWEEEVQALLRVCIVVHSPTYRDLRKLTTTCYMQCIEKPTKWAIRELHPMPRYSYRRVILGGDAVSLLYRRLLSAERG